MPRNHVTPTHLKINEALESDLFPPGLYRPMEIIHILTENKVITALECSAGCMSRYAKRASGWSWNGKGANDSRLTKEDPPVVIAPPAPEIEVIEAHDGFDHSPSILDRIKHLETMVGALCKAWKV